MYVVSNTNKSITVGLTPSNTWSWYLVEVLSLLQLNSTFLETSVELFSGDICITFWGVPGHVPHTGLFSDVRGEFVEKFSGSDAIWETHQKFIG